MGILETECRSGARDFAGLTIVNLVRLETLTSTYHSYIRIVKVLAHTLINYLITLVADIPVF